MDAYKDLAAFLDASPVNFLAVQTLREHLDKAGFTELSMADEWHITPGSRHYVTKNDSALFAFTAGGGGAASPFRIISAHSDSPGFRLKPGCEILCEGHVVKLNTDVYGGPNL